MSEASTPSESPLLESIQDFLFGAPLYAVYQIDSKIAIQFLVRDLAVDGHCPYCKKLATFHRTSANVNPDAVGAILYSTPVLYVVMSCTRDKEHIIHFLFRLNQPFIQKIGQFPSLADIANDESRQYRQVLNAKDGAELHRAIGLAAHGVGVGSFVYLRRIFERLVYKRFEEFKDVEGWNTADFTSKRMHEKIELLENHLPDFLVRNKKVYAILSKGIHELEETECLSAFEMLKQAIFFILDEDRHKKDELDRKRKAEAALAAFSSESSNNV
jgi:hypothetical protein